MNKSTRRLATVQRLKVCWDKMMKTLYKLLFINHNAYLFKFDLIKYFPLARNMYV